MKRRIVAAIMLALAVPVVPLVAETGDVVLSDAKLLSGKEMDVDLGGGVKLMLILIPPGEFTMGSNDGNSDEKPVRRVRITKGFWMGKFEVTQAQWEQVLGSNPSQFKGLRNPVDNVSWNDCQKFLKKLNQRAEVRSQVQNDAFRLPTEAEWEYACRAGTTTRFYSGAADSDLDRVSWYRGNGGWTTHPVGQKAPNAWGLYDMHGNVLEWCQDWYGTYAGESVTDPVGPMAGSSRVSRGGGWNSRDGGCRVTYRRSNLPHGANIDVGFRVALPSGSAVAP